MPAGKASGGSPSAWHALHVSLVVLGFFVLWQLGVLIFQPPDYLLPAPSAGFSQFMTAPLWYVDQALQTVGSTLLGFSLALIVGCLAAVGIVYSRVVENTLYTLLVALNSVPKVALAPLFIIWLGPGLGSQIAISFLIAVFAIVV